MALATNSEGETVEDQLIAIDMESGEMTLLVDFSALMNDYFVTTEKVSANSSFFWQAGLWDWLHLNSVQYWKRRTRWWSAPARPPPSSR